MNSGSSLRRLFELVYLLLIAMSFFLLSSSRTGEAHTVWEVLHLAFLPVLFLSTLFLLLTIFSSEDSTYKLLFVIVHSILIHSLFSVVFPVGDLSGQQVVLGRIRLVYENVAPRGLSPSAIEAFPVQIYQILRGENLQAALAVVFARMSCVDLLWVHLSLVPVAWGIFVPIGSYLITRTLTGNDEISVLSSLLVSVFPYSIYFGAISVPNSLGFLFFLYALYFMLNYLSSNKRRDVILMVLFSFFAFLAHYLAGVMALSLLLLAIAVKYYVEVKPASLAPRFSLMVSFVFSALLLPLSLIVLRYFRPATHVAFTLDKLTGLSLSELVGLFFLGDLIYGFDLKAIILIVVGPALGFICLIALLSRCVRNLKATHFEHVCFFFMALLVVLVDFGILKLFMSGLPLNEERLWVFRDFITAPFVAILIFVVVSHLKASIRPNLQPTTPLPRLGRTLRFKVFRIVSMAIILNLLVPVLLGGWSTFSLSVAYPQVAPLQTTWYELEAVKYIEDNTIDKYVVIGDIWTIFAGEVIVGIRNPRAYYFEEFSETGHDLFANMTREPSTQWMLLAMEYTDTKVAYLIVTEPRLGPNQFHDMISRALQNSQLEVAGIFGGERLYVFRYQQN